MWPRLSRGCGLCRRCTLYDQRDGAAARCPPQDLDVAAFLVSDRASFVTGHVMVADGGVLVNPHTL